MPGQCPLVTGGEYGGVGELKAVMASTLPPSCGPKPLICQGRRSWVSLWRGPRPTCRP